jgi:putative membrane protein insertion efficiency factor
VRRLVVRALELYKRRLSPLLPPACRFVPTCSEYARLAVLERGVVRGGLAACGRLLRCQPLHPGGIDLP